MLYCAALFARTWLLLLMIITDIIIIQDNVLFATSIKENIIYGMGQGHLPMPTDEEIWAVCDKANAREFIEAFPNLLNTRVGERGIKLSGGQKQVRFRHYCLVSSLIE